MKGSSFERLEPKIQDPSGIYVTAQEFLQAWHDTNEFPI